MPRVYKYENYTIYHFHDHIKILTPDGEHFAEVDTMTEAEKEIDKIVNPDTE